MGPLRVLDRCLLALSVLPLSALPAGGPAVAHVIAAAQPTAAPALSTTDIASQNSPGVVSIATPSGTGSGVIVSPSGVIVTSLHVVRGETSVVIKLANGDSYDDVSVIDVDERKDIVLLKTKAFGLSAVRLGNSDLVKVGDGVVLIGSPRGLDRTVSDGLISAVRDSGEGYRLLQTSAAASPGSSGGGMFNRSGELIGIVASKLTAGENLNFATPINYVRGMLATEPRMTLAQLAERFPSARENTTQQSSSPAQTSVQDGGAVKNARVSALIRASGVDFETHSDGSWSKSYRGENSSTVEVLVSAEGSLVFVQARAARGQALTTEAMRKILRLSYDANFAKAGLSQDHELVALEELDADSASGLQLKQAVLAVATLADALAGLPMTPSASDTRSSLVLPTGATDTFQILQGHATLRFRNANWKPAAPIEPVDGARKNQWAHSSGEVWAMVIQERAEIPIESMPDLAIVNAKKVDPSTKELARGTRLVNGRKLQFAEYQSELKGVPFIFYSHFYSDPSGTIQVIGWTAKNLLATHRGTIEAFVSGLQVK